MLSAGCLHYCLLIGQKVFSKLYDGKTADLVDITCWHNFPLVFKEIRLLVGRFRSNPSNKDSKQTSSTTSSSNSGQQAYGSSSQGGKGKGNRMNFMKNMLKCKQHSILNSSRSQVEKTFEFPFVLVVLIIMSVRLFLQYA